MIGQISASNQVDRTSFELAPN